MKKGIEFLAGFSQFSGVLKSFEGFYLKNQERKMHLKALTQAHWSVFA